MTTPAAAAAQKRRADFVALTYEADAAGSLLRQGFRALKQEDDLSADAEVLFACWSLGAEKLLKLSIGVSSLETAGTWATKSKMQGWGHNIVELHTELLRTIAANLSKSTAPGFIDQLRDTVVKDEALTGLIGALARYGMDGRFYNLDHLAGATQLEQPPRELLEENVHQPLLAAEPGLLSNINNLQANLNVRVADSFARWCELIYRCWRTGVFGDDAKGWAVSFVYRADS